MKLFFIATAGANLFSRFLQDIFAEGIVGLLPFSTEITTDATSSLLNHSDYQPLNRIKDAIRAKYPSCPITCETSMMNDNWCNFACYLPECGYDEAECEGWCAAECKPDWVGDGSCDMICFNEKCNWDNNDCEGKFDKQKDNFIIADADSFDYSNCTCNSHKLKNQHCDMDCNNAACNFDDGDCQEFCAIDCYNIWLGDGDCDTACFNEACNYDKGDCKECSPGCRPDRIGNGLCDKACMNAECDWDMGDCASVCKAYPIDYNTLPFNYYACRKEWLGDNLCDCYCYNEECKWDLGDCANNIQECEELLKQSNTFSGLSYP